MNRSPKTMIFRLCIAGLHCASWMVREEDRYEWLREWASELWYIASMLEGASLRESLSMLIFIRGAFPDAFLLAIHTRRAHRWKLPTLHSPAQCLLTLSFV